MCWVSSSALPNEQDQQRLTPMKSIPCSHLFSTKKAYRVAWPILGFQISLVYHDAQQGPGAMVLESLNVFILHWSHISWSYTVGRPCAGHWEYKEGGQTWSLSLWTFTLLKDEPASGACAVTSLGSLCNELSSTIGGSDRKNVPPVRLE